MQEDSGKRRLQTTKKIKGLTDGFYKDLYSAPREGRKVAWCVGPVPFAPLRAMGIPFLHTENYGARLAARQVAQYTLKAAEDWGLPRESCSYMRNSQGMSLFCAQEAVPTPPEFEAYRIPKPDMILCMNYCVIAVNIAEIMFRELKVPIYVIDNPFHHRDETEVDVETYVPYVTRNMKGYIAFLEEQMGRRMDYDRLSQIVEGLRQHSVLHNKIMALEKNIPAPFTTFDAMISMGVGMIWQGTPEAIQYLKELKAEVEERVKNKFAAVPGERFRLIWDYIAVWSRIGYLAKLFASHQAAMVWNIYSSLGPGAGYGEEMYDPSEPVVSLARVAVRARPWWHTSEVVRRIKAAAEEYSVDGIVGHSPKTCRRMSMGQPLYLNELSRLTGVPVLRFEADNSDPSFYSPAEVDTRIIAFLEMLDARKRKLGL